MKRTIVILRRPYQAKGKKYDVDFYPEWFRLACDIAELLGEEGRKRFRKYSKLSKKYKKKYCNKVYDLALEYTKD